MAAMCTIVESLHSNSFFFNNLFIPIIMEDLFKKFLYTGVGLVSTTVEKFQKSVEKLVDEDGRGFSFLFPF